MENASTSSSLLAVNGSRSLWPAIGDADLLPDDLSRTVKLTFIIAYTTIILLALGGNGLMMNRASKSHDHDHGRSAAMKNRRV